MNLLMKFFALTGLIALPEIALASETTTLLLDLTNHWVGFFYIGIFILAYILVMAEEYIKLSKSMPAMDYRMQPK
jgi:hypothetical protein